MKDQPNAGDGEFILEMVNGPETGKQIKVIFNQDETEPAWEGLPVEYAAHMHQFTAEQ